MVMVFMSGVQSSWSSKESLGSHWLGNGLFNERSDKEENRFLLSRHFPGRRPGTGSPQSQQGKSHTEVCVHTPPVAMRPTRYKDPQVSGTKVRMGKLIPTQYPIPQASLKGADAILIFSKTFASTSRYRPESQRITFREQLGGERGDLLAFIFLGEDWSVAKTTEKGESRDSLGPLTGLSQAHNQCLVTDTSAAGSSSPPFSPSPT